MNPLGFGPDLADVADRAHVGRLDPAWNSIPGVAVSDDPVIHHFAGLPHATRLKLLRSNAAILELYDSAPAPLRSALSRQINLWAATACEVHTLAEEARRLRAPRQMLRRFPGAVARRLREKVRGN